MNLMTWFMLGLLVGLTLRILDEHYDIFNNLMYWVSDKYEDYKKKKEMTKK